MISVIIPVYNQYSALDVVLWHFCNQTIEKFEIIIVDDGSAAYEPSIIAKYPQLQINLIRSNINGGRSKARNIAIDNSNGEFLIFCDCDRIPVPDFIESHMKLLESSNNVLSVGYVTETYECAERLNIKTDFIKRRKSIYYNAISQIYNEFGVTDSQLCWLSTLSGNMAIKKSTLRSYRFDCDFKEWGFEHFELGYRLWKDGIMFINNINAENIHIAHSRSSTFYKENIVNSHRVFYSKHPYKEILFLEGFLLGEFSLQEYEKKLQSFAKWMENKNKPIMVNCING